ncbi:restriction endonuclease subunit S [Brucella sp. BO2]|uniref:restriction endonuclease subunit S n=1 Tax=Brucella sp. BO2 TaxID=693750 RepID=UPI0002E5C0B3|nr:restriction endonuclease subunit S [Brucella sp. BO2]QPN27629.1 restriction endonuclease subunit S [Brucella sp. BO2]
MVKAGYKQTEVGEIPNDWSVSAVKEIASVRGGKRLPKGRTLLDQPTGHPYIRVADMLVGGVDLTDIKYVPDEVAPSIKNYRIGKDDIFISVAGTLGIVGCIPEELDGANLTENADKITNILINKNYLAYWLMSDPIQAEIQQQSTVGAQPKLALNKIQEFLLALPGDEVEQKIIAAALSDVDALIASLEKLIEKKRDIKTATMQQLLTGKKRLPGFGEGKGTKQTELGEIPDDWEVVPLGGLLQIRHGKSQKDVEDPGGEYPILATGGEIGRAKQPLYSKPSVLIGRKGTIDVPYYMDTPFWTVDTLFYSEVSDQADAKFLFYKFHFIDWYKYNEASGVPSLSSSTIEKILQVVPKERSEQESISSFISDFDSEISLLESKLTKTKAIKQGMMQELLTGRTRLV